MVMVPSENTEILFDEERSSIDWPAAFAAVVISAATLCVLTAFGAAIGFASVSPWSPNPSASTLVVGTAAWFALIILYAGGQGGYIVGRLRRPLSDVTRDEQSTRDGINGLVVWALGLILSSVLAAYVFTQSVSKVADVTAQAVGPALSETVKQATGRATDFASYYVDRALRTGAVPADNKNPPAATEDVRPQITQLLLRSLDGTLSQEDRKYLEQVVAQRTGLSEADAKTRVDQMINDGSAAYQKAVTDAKTVAEQARKAAIETTTWFAIVSMLAGLLSWFAAEIGGRHRDAKQVI